MNNNYVIKVGEVYSNPRKIGGNGRGAVYLPKGLAPTVVTMSGGGNHPFVVVEYEK